MNPRDCDHGRQIGKCADCDVLKLERINAQLLEALEGFVEHGTCSDDEDMAKARAAIKAAKEGA